MYSNRYNRSFVEHILENYIANKEQGWDDYRIAVTDWELNAYLNNY